MGCTSNRESFLSDVARATAYGAGLEARSLIRASTSVPREAPVGVHAEFIEQVRAAERAGRTLGTRPLRDVDKWRPESAVRQAMAAFRKSVRDARRVEEMLEGPPEPSGAVVRPGASSQGFPGDSDALDRRQSRHYRQPLGWPSPGTTGSCAPYELECEDVFDFPSFPVLDDFRSSPVCGWSYTARPLGCGDVNESPDPSACDYEDIQGRDASNLTFTKDGWSLESEDWGDTALGRLMKKSWGMLRCNKPFLRWVYQWIRGVHDTDSGDTIASAVDDHEFNLILLDDDERGLGVRGQDLESASWDQSHDIEIHRLNPRIQELTAVWRDGDSFDRMCASIKMASMLFHELWHLCYGNKRLTNPSNPAGDYDHTQTDQGNECYEVVVATNAMRWVLANEYGYALASPHCEGYLVERTVRAVREDIKFLDYTPDEVG